MSFKHDRPYAGTIKGNRFKMTSVSDNSKITSLINESNDGSVVKIMIKPFSMSDTTVFSSSMGMGAFFIFILGGLIYIFDAKPMVFVLSAIILGFVISCVIHMYNKYYKKILKENVNKASIFLLVF